MKYIKLFWGEAAIILTINIGVRVNSLTLQGYLLILLGMIPMILTTETLSFSLYIWSNRSRRWESQTVLVS